MHPNAPPERHQSFLEPERKSLQDEDGKWYSAYVAKCDECPAESILRVRTVAGSIPASMLLKKYRQRGWALGKRHTLCPACAVTPVAFKPKKEPVMEKPSPVLAVDNTPKPVLNAPPVGAELPRRMTRDERRAIMRAIDDNWDEKKSRYTGTTTDTSLATALNVPRKWVEEMRVETFGDSGANEDLEKLGIELRTARDRAQALFNQALEYASAIEGLQKEIAGLEKRVEKATKK